MRSNLNIGTTGVIINQAGELLVIQRDDTRTWGLPGGGLEAGEMPTDGIIREVEEETGYKILPVRLVAITFVPIPKHPSLVLVFRCLMRGGEEKTSAESLQISYIKTNPIDVPMLQMHKSRIEQALTHRGKASFGTYQLSLREKLLIFVVHKGIYRFKDWQRRWRGEPLYVPPMLWQVGVFVVIRDAAGAVLWVQRTDAGQRWNLPGGGAEPGETPWNAGVREVLEETGLHARLTELTGVYTKPAQQEQIFVFLGEVTGGQLTKGTESADFAYLQSGNEHPNTLPLHIERVADAIDPERELTIFKK